MLKRGDGPVQGLALSGASSFLIPFAPAADTASCCLSLSYTYSRWWVSPRAYAIISEVSGLRVGSVGDKTRQKLRHVVRCQKPDAKTRHRMAFNFKKQGGLKRGG